MIDLQSNLSHMKVFIFGAGASKGIGTISGTKLTFPITSELFDDTYMEFLSNRASHNDARFDFSQLVRKISVEGDLESYLTKKWENANKKKHKLYQKKEIKWFGGIGLYIWDLFKVLSLRSSDYNPYKNLLEKLEAREENFGLISFNYDTVLDRAYATLIHEEFNHLEIYLSNNFIKPHGSVNWFLRKREADRPVENRSSGDLNSRVNHIISQMYDGRSFQSGSIEILSPTHSDFKLDFWPLISSRFDNQYFFPLIFLPLTTKLNYLVPEMYKRMVEDAQAMLSQAKEIYFIGYRARDEIIKVMCSRVGPKAKIFVISNNDPGSIAKRLEKEVLKAKPKIEVSLDDFENFVNTF